jgi:hypothetical protein
MDTDAHEWESDLTEVVIGAAFEVANVIGAKAQVSFPISYKGKYLGEYAADLVVGEKVIVINFQKPKVEWKRVLLDR